MTARRCLLTTVAFLTVVILQLAHTVQTRADDGVPPVATPVVATTEAAPDGTPTEELTPDATEEPTDEATPEPTDETTLDPTDETTPDPTEEAAPEDEAAPESEDEAEPDPEADADSFSDPMWCPVGRVPGDAECTPSFGSLSELIAFLDANPSYSGDGTIYFQAGDYTDSVAPDDPLVIDCTVLDGLDNLVVFGGWDLDSTGGYDGNVGTTNFDVPLLVYWDDADITLIDLVFDLPAGSPDPAVFVSSTGNVTVQDVYTTGGSYGAQIVNYTGTGNVTVGNSEFSGATNTGLTVYSSGSVTLNDVIADGNNTGIIIDNTTGTANVTLTNVFVDGNGWTGMDIRAAGNIDMTDVGADNSTVGAYLQTNAGAGNIFVTNGTFNGNSDVGLKAITSTGNIALDNVSTDSGNVPGSIGAWIKSYDGGTISVANSTFVNADTGLFVVGTNTVTIDNVTASGNAGNGVEVQSGWVFACIPPDGITVTTTGGVFHDNGGYGVYVAPGPNGTGTIDTLADYLNNAAGDYLVDLERTCQPPPPDKEPPKPYDVVEVSGEGDDPVEPPDCDVYAGVILILPDGSRIKVGCPVEDPITVTDIAEEDLPGRPPAGATVVGAMDVAVDDLTVLPDGGWITVSFVIPEGMEDKHFSILFWDPAANDGNGAWIELPMNQFAGQVYPLHPDTPEDGMLILEGVYQCGNCVYVKVTFTGTFLLVAR